MIKRGSKARVILTLDCNKNCPGCCNKMEKFKSIMKEVDFEYLKNFDTIILTGGEPLLDPEYTLMIATRLKNLGKKIYLYTTQWDDSIVLEHIIAIVDGIHYTLHHPFSGRDQELFNEFQSSIKGLATKGDKSFRLYIESNINLNVHFNPSLFSRIEVKPWMREDQIELPEDELLILKK